MTVGALPGAGPLAPPAPKDDKLVAARQLEAFFVRRILAEARPKGGMLDGGFAGETFAQMLDEALSDQLSGAGKLGMAEMFASALGNGAARPTPPTGEVDPASPLGSHLPPSPGRIPATTLGGPTGPVSGELTPSFDGLPRMAMPVIGRPSSGYGPRINPVTGAPQGLHAGLDLAAPAGTPVRAAAGGTVTHAGPAGTYGNLVTLRHADGVETRYAHLSAVTVTTGTHIEPGQELGTVGSTGASTGPHLHFEVRQAGQPVDPAVLLPLNRSPNRANR